MNQEFIVQTNGQGLYEFTSQLEQWLEDQARASGLIHLYLPHTSCSLLIQENADPDVQIDLLAFYRRLVPNSDDPAMDYIIHTAEGPDDMPAHIKAAMLPMNLSIPVIGGRLALGTWQGIFLFEHRDRPHRRRVIATIL